MVKYRNFGLLLVLLVCAVMFVSACRSDDVNLDGDLMVIPSSSSMDSDPKSTFYCMGKVNNEIDNNVEKLLVELSYGVSNPKDFSDKAHRWG